MGEGNSGGGGFNPAFKSNWGEGRKMPKRSPLTPHPHPRLFFFLLHYNKLPAESSRIQMWRQFCIEHNSFQGKKNNYNYSLSVSLSHTHSLIECLLFLMKSRNRNYRPIPILDEPNKKMNLSQTRQMFVIR